MPACSRSIRSNCSTLASGDGPESRESICGNSSNEMVGRPVRKNMRTSFIAMEQSQL
jgi:hypothetical protein